MPSKRKKNEARKAKKEGRRESETLEILLSARARTPQGDILHLDQKALKCTTCKLVCGKF